LKKSGSWNTRRVGIAAIFALTLLYGANELLRGGSPRDGGTMAAKSAQAATMTMQAPGGVEEHKTLARSTGPCAAALQEAERWRTRRWEGVDLFSGKSWIYSEEVKPPVQIPAAGDTVLQATSYSSDGWRAVIGGKVLRVGDDLLGGTVVSISEGTVVVRGTGWEKVLRFSKM